MPRGTNFSVSTDLVNWTTKRLDGILNEYRSVGFGNGIFVALMRDYGDLSNLAGFGLNNGRVKTSTDGINWSAATVLPDFLLANGDPHEPQGMLYLGPIYANGTYAAVVTTPFYDEDGLITSTDGVNWTYSVIDEATIPNVDKIKSKDFQYVDGHWVISGSQRKAADDGGGNSIRSTDLVNWESFDRVLDPTINPNDGQFVYDDGNYIQAIGNGAAFSKVTKAALYFEGAKLLTVNDIDSEYVEALITFPEDQVGLDSSQTTNLIDSAYIANRIPSSGAVSGAVFIPASDASPTQMVGNVKKRLGVFSDANFSRVREGVYRIDMDSNNAFYPSDEYYAVTVTIEAGTDYTASSRSGSVLNKSRSSFEVLLERADTGADEDDFPSVSVMLIS